MAMRQQRLCACRPLHVISAVRRANIANRSMRYVNGDATAAALCM